MTDADGFLTTAGLRVLGVLAVVAAVLLLVVTRDTSRAEPPPLVRLVPALTTSTTSSTTSTTSPPPSTSTTSNPPVASTTTTVTPAPTAADLNDSVPPPRDTSRGAEWAATGERRRTSSTVYCVSGVTYSGGQTHAEGPGVGRVAAVNRDNGEWEQYAGTSWRVLTGPHAGAVYTIEDAGPAAHFDQWHGDRADCRDYALGSYGNPTITLERVTPV